MNRRWNYILLTFVVMLILVSLYSVTRQITSRPKFSGCYLLHNDRLRLEDGKVNLNDTNIGSFIFESGDATKGPDLIQFTPTGPDVLSYIDADRVWFVTKNGLVLRDTKGEKILASPCPRQGA